MAREAIVELKSIEKTFPSRSGHASVQALRNIDLNVARGSILGVIGRSGAGKSTLIRLVNGLERPTSGSVIIDGTDITRLDEAALRRERRSIGMIFQHFNLLARRTAFQNVALPLEIIGTNRSEIEKRVRPLLDLVGLADKADRYPAELSGGQKQRVGIARALATDPKVLLSDEATSALDPETTEQILALLKQVNRDLGVTILLITHEMSVINAVTDSVAVIDGGEIVEHGATFDVFTEPRHETTRSFVSAVTGAVLPDHLREKLTASRSPGAKALVRVVFKGPGSEAPFISHLSRELGLDLSIVQGKVDQIAGQTFGQLVFSVEGTDTALAALDTGAHAHGLTTEVLGYVS
ncbi:methionine ABC transporter ATP-binding protein [Stappia sp.]|uniref:methionine ABC transporter ATP-binding protein n=1 Tax=Stappia sp. TaxID=1870903 RepID=UPI003A9A4117